MKSLNISEYNKGVIKGAFYVLMIQVIMFLVICTVGYLNNIRVELRPVEIIEIVKPIN